MSGSPDLDPIRDSEPGIGLFDVELTPIMAHGLGMYVGAFFAYHGYTLAALVGATFAVVASFLLEVSQ